MSSCEAELNSTLKGAIEGLNVQRLANALNDWPSLELRTDASAARGVIMRQGVGKVRHLHVKQLWIQEAVAAGELVVTKVPRAENCADALTHAWSSADLAFWSEMGLRFSNAHDQHQDSSLSSSSSTQGPFLQLLHLEAAVEGPRERTPCAPSSITITTIVPQGAQWPVAKPKDPAPEGLDKGVAQRKEKTRPGWAGQRIYPGAGIPALDAGSPRAKRGHWA